MCLQTDFSKCDDILIYLHYGIPSTNNERLVIIAQKPTSYCMAVSSTDQCHNLLPTYAVPSVMKPKCCLLLDQNVINEFFKKQ